MLFFIPEVVIIYLHLLVPYGRHAPMNSKNPRLSQRIIAFSGGDFLFTRKRPQEQYDAQLDARLRSVRTRRGQRARLLPLAQAKDGTDRALRFR